MKPALLLAGFTLLASSILPAAQITSLSPQGEVASVQQIVVKFDEAMVAFGDPKLPAPLSLSCSDASASKGQGRWLNDKSWSYDFEKSLPPGVKCTVKINSNLKSQAGKAYSGPGQYAFNTGGPFVEQAYPYGNIEEDQIFVLTLNGPVTPESVRANVWCQAKGIGERIPVQLADNKTRELMLKERQLQKKASQVLTLSCQQRLPSGADVQLVFGKGVSTPSGIANKVEKRLNFKVRDPFKVTMQCEREHANAPCLPISPISLDFSAPLSRKIAEKIVLISPDGKQSPTLPKAEDSPDSVTNITFSPPFTEDAQLSIELPKDIKDESGRALVNADKFPLKTATGHLPPLAKFAAAPFGIVERFAEKDTPPLLPVTLRNVEASLKIKGLRASHVSDLHISSDADIIRWFKLVKAMDERTYDRKEFSNKFGKIVDTPKLGNANGDIETRAISLLKKQNKAATLTLPPPADGKLHPFEVVGIPINEPGYHVVEIESGLLGQSLLGRKAPMYVRTGVLVTNMAVHFKQSRENALAWVTSLDRGQPMADAVVQISDCHGKMIAAGATNKYGIALFPQALPRATSEEEDGECSGLFISARYKDAQGKEDLSFVMSNWDRGIEAYRFGLNTDYSPEQTVRAHTVMDRMLFRAGETVSMKHFIRAETSKGFINPKEMPDSATITHRGTGQEFSIDLEWRRTATGGMSASSQFEIPKSAKLGVYDITMTLPSREEYAGTINTGSFRVEEFRLPVLAGLIGLTGGSKATPLVKAKEGEFDVQINYVSGGGASGLPVQVSAVQRPLSFQPKNYAEFSFNPYMPRDDRKEGEDEDATEESTASKQKLVADKLPLTLDKNGAGRLKIPNLPEVTEPQSLLLEASFADPNGEIQTIRGETTLWPAAVQVGIKAQSWVSVKDRAGLQIVTLDLNGKPKAGVSVDVEAVATITTSTRKRIAGGFYAYDHHTETRKQGSVCSGKSDSKGLFTCDAKLESHGDIQLIATAKDDQGNKVNAATSVWVTQQDELWFNAEDNDRIDLIPEKRVYSEGDTARFQVRMPFRRATALVTVEREGIMESEIVELKGSDPTLSLKIKPEWTPNVYVSALVVRGRLREVPWYSIFSWGWRAPGKWWAAYSEEGRDYEAPTAMVDLAKPSYRLGITGITVQSKQHQLDVNVKTDKDSYAVRGKARASIEVKLPDGQPAANGEVAVAVVDEALLELLPNSSWNVLDAILQERAYTVSTATNLMEVIGRRHYGRKALPAGGGGGGAPTRELLDTLLLWKPDVKLDAQGRAAVDIPINDAITRFRVVVIADHGTNRFGTGQTSFTVNQDLQIISGLPPLVREDDQFRAMVTLRNTTNRAMRVQLSATGLPGAAPQSVDIPAGEAREAGWDITVPATLGSNPSGLLEWTLEAHEQGSNGARDKLKVVQKLVPAVPLTVQQGTLMRLDGPLNYPVTQPADSLPGRGGIRLALQPRLVEGLPAIRDWFIRYPYACLEQKTSKAVGLRDTKLWSNVAEQIPTYLDSDGLANYFPPRAGDANHGSDTLTAYLLSATHEASQLGLDFQIPDESQAAMQQGLINFVEGRIKRDFWAPQKDLDVRKISAMEALSRYGKVDAKMLGSITIAPNQWPTHAVIDWYSILLRTPSLPQRAERLKEAEQILRSRMSYQGTRVIFSTEKDDYWWWLMVNSDLNAAKLLSLVMDQPQWQDEVPRLVTGMIGRQKNGTWATTTANLWGGLALEKFSRKYESEPVTGTTQARLDKAGSTGSVDWSRVSKVTSAEGIGPEVVGGISTLKNNLIMLAWGTKPAPDQLQVTHAGSGKPWLTVQSIAAVQLKQPFASGYRVKKTITPVEQAVKGQYSRGDILRITLEVDAQTDMTWVVVNDPIPAGASILGSGLGRDSAIATQSEHKSGSAWVAFEERSFEAYRAYYDYLPKGNVKLEYTVRLNNAGQFSLPPTRVEAMYAPEMFGESPNDKVKVTHK